MANINTPLTATQTETQMDDTVQNPTTTVSTDAALGQIVHIALRFSGVNIDPAAIFDMVDAQYGTVATVKNQCARGCYSFQIEA